MKYRFELEIVLETGQGVTIDPTEAADVLKDEIDGMNAVWVDNDDGESIELAIDVVSCVEQAEAKGA